VAHVFCSNLVSLHGVLRVRIKRCMRSSVSLALVSSHITPVRASLTCGLDIAAVSKKVIAFYKQKGGEVVSPLVKAIKL
jgi:hypothetical protein